MWRKVNDWRANRCLKLKLSLTFKANFDSIQKKVLDRLKIVRIISHRSWKLNKKTLLSIYKALVRSILEYCSFSISLLSKTLVKKLQVYQNHAIRSIFKPGFRVNLINLGRTVQLQTIEERFTALFACYIVRTITDENPLIVQLAFEYRRGFEAKAYCGAAAGCPLETFSPLCQFREMLFGTT